MKKPPRNLKDIKCQRILKCGGFCRSVAIYNIIEGNHIAVGVDNQIKVYDKSSTDLLHTIGHVQLGNYLPGVIFYDQEHILVSDYFNDTIEMVTLQGEHVRTIDRRRTCFNPLGITISRDGHIYVCDAAFSCVCVFDVNGKFLFSFGSCGSGDECFDYPRDLCFASDGFLYIIDVNNSRICVYNKDGTFIRKFHTTYKPWCIDATDCGHLIVTSSLYHKVMIYTIGGYLIHVFGEHGSGLGQFDGPTGVSVDSDGLIYIADNGNNRIQVF